LDKVFSQAVDLVASRDQDDQSLEDGGVDDSFVNILVLLKN